MWSSYFTSSSSAIASRCLSKPGNAEVEPQNGSPHYVRLVRKPQLAHACVSDSALSPHYVRLVRVKVGLLCHDIAPCPGQSSSSSSDAGQQHLIDQASITPRPRTPPRAPSSPLTWV